MQCCKLDLYTESARKLEDTEFRRIQFSVWHGYCRIERCVAEFVFGQRGKRLGALSTTAFVPNELETEIRWDVQSIMAVAHSCAKKTREMVDADDSTAVSRDCAKCVWRRRRCKDPSQSWRGADTLICLWLLPRTLCYMCLQNITSLLYMDVHVVLYAEQTFLTLTSPFLDIILLQVTPNNFTRICMCGNIGYIPNFSTVL